MSAKSPVVLLIEDDPHLARIIERVCVRKWPTVTAKSFREACEILDAGTPVFAAIVDVSLGDGDGFALLSRMRKHGAKTPVLVMSGMDERDYPERALLLEASYVRKPFELSSLEAFLDRALEKATQTAAPAERLEAEVLALAKRHGLSPRQTEVLRGAVFDESEKEIAERIGIEVTTLRTHVRALLSKIGAMSLAEIARAVRASARS